jgi:hypothetical protein
MKLHMHCLQIHCHFVQLYISVVREHKAKPLRGFFVDLPYRQFERASYRLCYTPVVYSRSTSSLYGEDRQQISLKKYWHGET